jgi:anti-sigma factor RsiW
MRSDDLKRLNALIDGELPPAEHAALAARIATVRELAHAHATLARLKACIVDGLGAAPAVDPEQPQPAARRRPLALALGATAAAALAAAIVMLLQWHDPDPEPVVRTEAAITLAALPTTPVIPDLAVGGLTLIGTEVEQVGGTAVLVAAYRGPRGCRLELRVRPSAADVPPTAGTSRWTWTVGALSYELAAFGMPAARFAAIADVAQAATRAGQAPQPKIARMQEARRAAMPCLA